MTTLNPDPAPPHARGALETMETSSVDGGVGPAGTGDAGPIVRVAFARRWALGYVFGGGLLFLSCLVAAIAIVWHQGMTLGFWIALPLGLFGVLVTAGALPLLVTARSVIEADGAGVRIGLGLDREIPWHAITRFELTRVAGLRSIAIVTDDPRASALSDDGSGAAFAGAFGALAQRLHAERGVLAIAVIKTSLMKGTPKEIVTALEGAREKSKRRPTGGTGEQDPRA